MHSIPFLSLFLIYRYRHFKKGGFLNYAKPSYWITRILLKSSPTYAGSGSRLLWPLLCPYLKPILQLYGYASEVPVRKKQYRTSLKSPTHAGTGPSLVWPVLCPYLQPILKLYGYASEALGRKNQYRTSLSSPIHAGTGSSLVWPVLCPYLQPILKIYGYASEVPVRKKQYRTSLYPRHMQVLAPALSDQHCALTYNQYCNCTGIPLRCQFGRTSTEHRYHLGNLTILAPAPATSSAPLLSKPNPYCRSTWAVVDFSLSIFELLTFLSRRSF